ncbi:MAG TPA: dUTP diphosphatase [Chlamydiales bacterium]|nr:dUTP diphosphatase [Chlamydiales bacterium]
MDTTTFLEALAAEKTVKIKIIAERADILPLYASEGAAGADVFACIDKEVVIQPGSIQLISTGLKMEIPRGYEVQIRPRSGLAAKFGVTVLNTPGTIDSDYRGDVRVCLINHGVADFIVTPLMRIAQIVVAPVVTAQFILTQQLESTQRGAGGFGHTGT